MPLLYGEGANKAFRRLQLEIIKISNDESIFAWTGSDAYSSILVTSPTEFLHSENIICGDDCRPPWTMTHKGLEIVIPKQHTAVSHYATPDRSTYIVLNCYRNGDHIKPLVLRVEMLSPGNTAGFRSCGTLDADDWPPRLKTKLMNLDSLFVSRQDKGDYIYVDRENLSILLNEPDMCETIYVRDPAITKRYSRL